jgi:phage baseplate assembly protein V
VLDQLAYDIRVNAHRGVVQSMNDGGQAQTATVTSHDGFTRADLQVMQQFGFASAPPGDGAIGVMLAIGNDAAQFVMLPLCCPAIRFGNLLNGESVQYGSDGSRVHIRQGGTIEVKAATQILVQVGSNSLTISSAGIVLAAGGVSLTVSTSGVAIVGNLTTQNIEATGSITATGNITPNV